MIANALDLPNTTFATTPLPDMLPGPEASVCNAGKARVSKLQCDDNASLKGRMRKKKKPFVHDAACETWATVLLGVHCSTEFCRDGMVGLVVSSIHLSSASSHKFRVEPLSLDGSCLECGASLPCNCRNNSYWLLHDEVLLGLRCLLSTHFASSPSNKLCFEPHRRGHVVGCELVLSRVSSPSRSPSSSRH